MPELLFESVNPEDYLEFAKNLNSKNDGVSKRTAADRAYYAAFLYSREILTEKGYYTPVYNNQEHQKVVEKLKERNILGSRGGQLESLRRARNEVTYRIDDLYLSMNSWTRSLQWMIDSTEKFLEMVKAIPDNNSK
ncbi:MAG: hypothetical protein JW712_06695 [Dehalococcoidales bacterium]|nr:hypothetical protein [Dehalococcoidales bacterium]